jgi:DNA modification methylase
MKELKLLNGDCLDKLKELDNNSIDSIVTDPPYGLSFMGKKWDYDVPSVEIWQECLRVLKPGGHLLAFAGSRTYHRMAVRIEDAGFDIRDQIMWIYGSGFPKSHNISKQLDKRGGNNNLTKEVADALKEARVSRGISKTEADKLFCDGTTNYQWFEGRKDGVRLPDDETFQKICNEWNELDKYKTIINSVNREVVGKYEGDAGGLGGERLGSKGGDITIPATNVAKDWEGWGTALKPAHEPIVMARKPIEGTVAENTLQYGVGGLNIDGTRVGTEKTITKSTKSHKDDKVYGKFNGGEDTINEGRWPANVILDEEAGQILDEQSGERGNGWKKNYGATDYNGKQYDSSTQQCVFGGGFTGKNTYADTGGASRFFYCPKASKKDRDHGLDKFDTKSTRKWTDTGMKTTGSGNPRQELGKNIHPTVKPTDLMKYLIRLVTPKDGIVLDPFMGSGSTGKAAMQEGMWFVGIEREKEYYEIAKQRIEHEMDKRKFW